MCTVTPVCKGEVWADLAEVPLRSLRLLGEADDEPDQLVQRHGDHLFPDPGERQIRDELVFRSDVRLDGVEVQPLGEKMAVGQHRQFG